MNKEFTIGYYTTPYNSLQRIARLYQEVLEGSHNRVIKVNGPEDAHLAMEADLVILHVFPYQIEAIYSTYPFLAEKYVIGYLVWEASDLTESGIRGLSRIQEVWTASDYCCKIFQKYHMRVVRIPHVVERNTRFSQEDTALMKEEIKYQDGLVYYLAILSVNNRRKNAHGLIKAFQQVSKTMENARLIIKSTWPLDPANLVEAPRIIYLRKDFNHQQINALYALSDVYVSAHHAEGWGFNLSDAIIFQLPVIVTGYSGNMEFMSEATSFLVKFTEDYINQEDVGFPFDASMKWAYPDESDLKEKLVMLYNNFSKAWVKEKTLGALVELKKFDKQTVQNLIQKRLQEIQMQLTSTPFHS